MIIHYFHVKCIATAPNKTQSPLVVDSNTVLAFPITVQFFQSISGRIFQIGQRISNMQKSQFSVGLALDLNGKPSTMLPEKHLLG